MKIRTDFVTNSSSSSFVTVIAEYKNGLRKKAELEYNQDEGPLKASQFTRVKSGKDILETLDRLYDYAGGRDDYPDPEVDRLKSIRDLSELSRLEVRARSDWDDGSFYSKVILIGDPKRKEKTRAEWEKLYRYGPSGLEKHFPDLDSGGFSPYAIKGYLGKEPDVVVPGFILKGNIVEIGAKAFAALDHITSVTIPEGVVSIGTNAFANCPNLKTVKLPSTLCKIGAKAFAGCPVLEKPEIPAGTEVAGNAFSAKSDAVGKSFSARPEPDADELQEAKKRFDLRVNKSSVSILGCKKKEKVLEFPETIAGLPVSSIDLNVFNGDQALEKVIIPRVSALSGVFRNCPNLKEVIVPETVTYFSGNEFENTPFWDSFPGLVVINHIALGYNGDDPLVILPPEVTELAGDFMRRSPKVRVLVIPKTMTKLHSESMDCVFPIEVRFPDGHFGLTELRKFDHCWLKKLCGPAGSKIEKYAEKRGVPFEAI